MDNFGAAERLVATSVRLVKTGRTGKELWGRCSRIVTDQLGVFHRDNRNAESAGLGHTSGGTAEAISSTRWRAIYATERF
jgi:hypothetical protein